LVVLTAIDIMGKEQRKILQMSALLNQKNKRAITSPPPLYVTWNSTNDKYNI
jgi:hypothetical protein